VVSARPTGSHLHYVDLVRVLTVALVIGVHALGAGSFPQTLPTGAVEIVLHSSREVFFLLTAFVLIYGSERAPARNLSYWLRFWRRRYLFVGVPYVVWSVVYFLALGNALTPLGPQAALLGDELLNGTANYHLYFLLVSMQMYLVFPAIRALLRATAGHHGLLLGVGVTYQLLFSWAIQDHWPSGPLAGWLDAPTSWLPSYLGYVLMGALAGWHRESLTRWTRSHLPVVAASCAAAVALGVAVYLLQAVGEGQPPATAAAVLQPVVVVESAAIAWAFLAAGLRWEDRGLPGRRWIHAASDASFGVYLSHPLLLQGLFAASGALGLTAAADRSSGPLPLILLLLAVAPAVYAASALLSAALRHTPASLPLTGRRRLRREPPTRPAPVGARPRPARPAALAPPFQNAPMEVDDVFPPVRS
jgi:surface polysaccharide O-acyltransferase-like enzyme